MIKVANLMADKSTLSVVLKNKDLGESLKKFEIDCFPVI